MTDGRSARCDCRVKTVEPEAQTKAKLKNRLTATAIRLQTANLQMIPVLVDAYLVVHYLASAQYVNEVVIEFGILSTSFQFLHDPGLVSSWILKFSQKRADFLNALLGWLPR